MRFSRSKTINQLVALSIIILMLALSFHNQGYQPSKLDRLTEIRHWALQQKLWPSLNQEDALIAVRQVYAVEQSNHLKVEAYILVPCEEICGQSPSCARSCQNHLIQHWNGISSKALLMIEGFDRKEQISLGRLVLKDIAPIKLRYFSRKHGLIALIQSQSKQDHTLHLLRLGNEDRQLEYYDQLQLGKFHGDESPLEGSISFKTAPNGKLEMLAPLESLVKLKPAFYLPVPYQLNPQGLKLTPKLINLNSPKPDDLRNWLISVRGTDAESMSSEKIKATLSFCLLLCLKGQCEQGEELVKFAYPQHELILGLWKQLRVYVDQRMEEKAQTTKLSPYSILDK